MLTQWPSNTPPNLRIQRPALRAAADPVS